MSYQRERDQFIATVTREGLPLWIAERLLREATGFQRRAELACSSEAADRDRVPCPATRVHGKKRAPTVDGVAPCLCDDYPAGSHAAGQHSTILRITLQDWHAEQRCNKLLAEASKTIRVETAVNDVLGVGWRLLTAGDPRGYTLRIVPPSYAERNAGRDVHNLDSIGVPARATRA